MIKNNIFLHFLYLLSTKKIAENLYLEGGASLSFIHGLKRVFSNDLDFTIEDEKFRLKLLTTVKIIMKEISKNNNYKVESKNNRIIIKDDKIIVLQLDVYTLSSDLFIWEKNILNYNNKKFIIRSHSLIDIFAEKITNIFQEDRCEFKDIIDINNIFLKISPALDSIFLKNYLHNKFTGKKINNKTLNYYLQKKPKFKKSFLVYPSLNKISFNSEFLLCKKIIIQYL